jgi:uncharacterized LabA/DUF88 family protein
MSQKQPITYAFIDSQNLRKSTDELGWQIDDFRFRKYLSEKYHVKKAYIFIGYIHEYARLYERLQSAGFVCIFRPTLKNKDGSIKGNCDAELVLQAMIDYDEYDKAVIVAGDGDYQCLARYLYETDKLGVLLIPNQKKFSALLKYDIFKPYHRFVSDLRAKIEYKKPKKKSLRKDENLKRTSTIGDKPIVANRAAKVNSKSQKLRVKGVKK